MSRECLATLWQAIEDGSTDHTSIVVPSLSFDREELAKISGAPRYEERLLFSLMRLRDPRARVIYVTSQPLHPEIVDYYLGLLTGVSARSSRARLQLFCCYDGTARPLTEKILERPRLIQRIRAAMGPAEGAYLTCFNSTPLEQRLAETLGIPLNGCDPALLDLGSKSGGREIFRAAGVSLPEGRERLHTVDEVMDALVEIWKPGLQRAVIKLNHSFAGAGNAVMTYPQERPTDPAAQRNAVMQALGALSFTGDATAEPFFDKLQIMGGVVEEMIQAPEVLSPSVQLRLTPVGELEVVSTHDQILGGATGQSYSGCRFPANEAYRLRIQADALAVGKELERRGVSSRFAVDFVVAPSDDGGPWQAWAIEINLRMGGTTIPFLALQFLTGGRLRPDEGTFEAPDGQLKFYRATDSLTGPSYRGLLPEDLMDILDEYRLGFSPDRQTGVLFHMMGALSEHGKLGVTAIGNSPQEAEKFFQRTVEVLDGVTAGQAERPEPPILRLPME